MNIKVRFYSRSGNTEKLAKGIAEALGCECSDISAGLGEKTDVLFLGSSVYAGGFDASVGDFIKQNADKIGQIVCFGSSASGRSTYNKVKALAEASGIKIYKDFYNCPGHFMFLNKTRPNEKDIGEAADFAKKAVAELS